eukprot:11294915-Alexandrium_andersonii.AAC.1
MSASLVGSEMCIRDRRRVGHELGGAAPHDSAPHRRHNASRDHLDSPGGFCLLYTSDAADDIV